MKSLSRRILKLLNGNIPKEIIRSNNTHYEPNSARSLFGIRWKDGLCEKLIVTEDLADWHQQPREVYWQDSILILQALLDRVKRQNNIA